MRLSRDTPGPFPVLIGLVAGDDQHDARLGAAAHGIEQRHGAEHIGRECLDRCGIRGTDQRLCGQVHHHLGLRGLQCGFQRRAVIDVGVDEATAGGQVQQVVKVRLGGRRQGKARDLRPPFRPASSQPGALESGVAGDHYPAARPKAWHHQLFQGGLSEAQSRSR